MFIVYVEVAEGKPVSVDLELVNGLKAVTDKVTALVIGKDAEAAAKEAVAWGADSAIVVDGEQFEKYNSDAYAEAIAQVAKENAPEAVILGATQWGKELVPRVAAKLATGCANDVVGLKRDGDQLIFTVPAYSGNVLTDMTIEGNPVVASVRGGTFSKADAADEGKAADIAKKDITVDASLIRAQVKEAVEETSDEDEKAAKKSKAKKPKKEAKKRAVNQKFWYLTFDEIIDCLKNGYTTDEEISEKTNCKLNIVRKILYKLYDMRLASYKRDKDKETQWYTYDWRFNENEYKKLEFNLASSELKRLNSELEYEENNMFFVCPNGHYRLDFEDASTVEFLCPECDLDLEYEDNQEKIDRKKEEIKVLEDIISG